MADPFYPSVDIAFLIEQINESSKIIKDSYFQVGTTTNFVMIGSRPIHKRLVQIRELSPGQICYEQATGVAINLGFLGRLMEWLEQERNWKEGGYIE